MRFVLPWLRYGLPGDAAQARGVLEYGVTARSNGFPEALAHLGRDTALYGALPDEARRHRNPNHASSRRPHFIVRLIVARDAPEIAVTQYFALPEAVGKSASRPTVDALTFLVSAEASAASFRDGASIDDWAIAVSRALARPDNGVRPTSRARRILADDLVLDGIFDRTADENAALALGALAALAGSAGNESPVPGRIGPTAFLVAAFRALQGALQSDVDKPAVATPIVAAYGSWPTDPGFIVQAGQDSVLAHGAQFAQAPEAALALDFPASAHWARAFRLLIDAGALAGADGRGDRFEQAPTSIASERIAIARLSTAPPDVRAGLPAASAAVANVLSAVGVAVEPSVAAGVACVLDRLSRLDEALNAARATEAAA